MTPLPPASMLPPLRLALALALSGTEGSASRPGYLSRRHRDSNAEAALRMCDYPQGPQRGRRGTETLLRIKVPASVFKTPSALEKPEVTSSSSQKGEARDDPEIADSSFV